MRFCMQEFRQELSQCWRQLENKSFFFVLLAAWILLFQFLGNSTFGYFDTPSLLSWMWNVYTVENSDDSHGLLIPFAVLFLFWCKRKVLMAIPQKNWSPALIFFFFAVVLHLFGYVVQQPRISIVA